MTVYEIITEKIIEKLSSGVIPWRKSWSIALPKSYSTKKEYRGINLFLLQGDGFKSRYWITYKEAQKSGGQVRAGEKGSLVVYWHWRTPVEMAKLQASGKSQNPSPCYPFISKVFNLDQVEGIKSPEDDLKINEAQKLEIAPAVYENMRDKPAILHGQDFSPAYSPSRDAIRLPFMNQFESADLYYSTLFHELIHSTGHQSRLARLDSGARNSDSYSFEELIAEFGAAFLCGFSGIENNRTLEDSASYIKGWISVLENDKTILLKAASAAQKAVDFICEVKSEEIDDSEIQVVV